MVYGIGYELINYKSKGVMGSVDGSGGSKLGVVEFMLWEVIAVVLAKVTYRKFVWNEGISLNDCDGSVQFQTVLYTRLHHA